MPMYIRNVLLSLVVVILIDTPFAEAGPSDLNLLTLTNYDLEQSYETFVKEIAFGLYFNPGNSGAPLKESVGSGRGRGGMRGRGAPRGGRGSGKNGIKISVEAGVLSPSSTTVNAFTTSGGGDIASSPITKLKFQTGLPRGIDIGYNFSYFGKFISSSGMELRYDIGQFIGIPTFSLSTRMHYSSAIVTTELAIYSAGLDFIAGLNLGALEPYLSIGALSVRGSPSKALTDKNPLFVIDTVLTGMPITIGVKVVPIRNFSTIAEIGIMGDAKTFSLGFGLDF